MHAHLLTRSTDSLTSHHLPFRFFFTAFHRKKDRHLGTHEHDALAGLCPAARERARRGCSPLVVCSFRATLPVSAAAPLEHSTRDSQEPLGGYWVGGGPGDGGDGRDVTRAAPPRL